MVMDMVRDRVRDRDISRVRDRVRLRGLAIAAPSYSGWGRILDFALYIIHNLVQRFLLITISLCKSRLSKKLK